MAICASSLSNNIIYLATKLTRITNPNTNIAPISALLNSKKKKRVAIAVKLLTRSRCWSLSIFQVTAQEQTSCLPQQTWNRLVGAREPFQSPAGSADWPGLLSLPSEPNTDDVMGIIKTSIVIALFYFCPHHLNLGTELGESPVYHTYSHPQ